MQVYLRGAEDDSAIVLSSAGSFLLLTAEADGHWTEAIVDAEEVLMFYDSDTTWRFKRSSSSKELVLVIFTKKKKTRKS